MFLSEGKVFSVDSSKEVILPVKRQLKMPLWLLHTAKYIHPTNTQIRDYKLRDGGMEV